MSDEVNVNSVQETEALQSVLNVREKDYTFNYSVEVVDKFTKKFHISVDETIIAVAELEGYYKNKSKYAVPGFRKGKATFKQIKNYYGDDVFFNDAIDYIIDNVYRVLYQPVIMKENIAANPDIEIKSITRTSFEYSYIITVFAEVGELTYKGLEIHLEDEEKYINDLAEKKLVEAREKVGSWENVEGRSVQNGDTANINYVGTIDGVAFDGGSDNEYDLLIGSQRFIPGFEDGVIGMNVGETKDINVTFPTDYHAELAGKDAVFTVTVNAIKTKVLPEMDDDFAKDVSDYDTLEEYKNSLKAEAEKEGKVQLENININRIFDAVINANEYEIPAKALEEAAEKELKGLEENLSKSGLSLETYFQYIGKTKESFTDEVKHHEASKQKSSIILSAIAEKEGVKIEDSDIEADILEKANKVNKTVEEYKSEMNNEEYTYIVNSIYTKKVVELLKGLNTIIIDK